MAETKPKILIIEDDKAIGEGMQQVFTNEGFDVVLAPDGETGAASAKSEQPDVIMLDVLLPDLTGWEVLTKIKEDDTTRDIPVIIDSNLYSAERETEFLDRGAVEYIVKSDLAPKVIIEKVKAAMKEHPRAQKAT